MITNLENAFAPYPTSAAFGGQSSDSLGALPFFPSFASFLPPADSHVAPASQGADSQWPCQNSKMHQPQQSVYLPPTTQPGRMTLFLDMDDTLLRTYSFAELQCMPGLVRNFDFAVCFMNHAFELEHRAVFKRRGLDRFLEEVSRLFEVCLYTAADRDYAEAIIEVLDPHRRIFQHVLCREECTKRREGNYVKQLSCIKGRAPERMLLVDDNPENIRENEGRAISIRPFGYSLGCDNELSEVLGSLKAAAGVHN